MKPQSEQVAPDWTPDRTGIEGRKEWFPRDWGNLLDWPALAGCQVIADSSARVLAAGPGLSAARDMPDRYPDLDALISRFRYASTDELFALASADTNIVWMTCGSQLSAPSLWLDRYSSAMDSVRYYAIVGCSVFNMGYAGVSLFEGKTKRRLVLFMGGKVVERPAGV
jgi:hypothetical protein